MAATQTVAQPVLLRKSESEVSELKPKQGVITLTGYGISVRVDRGHLILEDGIGTDRRQCRLPRVDHGLKRLVVIGSDGMVSLAALRWLADQNSSFAMLDRDGSVLAITGPVRSSDVKLRRAQALALENGTAFRTSRELIDRKLAGQEKIAIERLHDESTAFAIRKFRSGLAEVESIDAVRSIEAQAAQAYWSAWRALPIMFPRKDLPRVPDHWRTFGSRTSSLTGSPRLATNPVNAMLNYLYALLEAEARLAAATLGLDPGIGVLHVDTPYRDSLACDLMEPIRADVDAFVLDWLQREPLPRNLFFEQRDGNCRLMDSLASRLSQTAPNWARLVAPIAEWFAHEIGKSRTSAQRGLPARLTQRHRREVRGGDSLPKGKALSKPKRVCRGCGKDIGNRHMNCNHCVKELRVDDFAEYARLGRLAALAPEPQAKRAETQRIKARARWDWKPSDQPKWLTSDFYTTKVQPSLVTVSSASIAKSLNVSYPYADHIRKGRVPHQRHWQALAELAGLSPK
jgi:CRISPR-associated endonuclease Cas1